MKSATRSFGIATAREFLEHLVHSELEALRHHESSSKTAISAAIFCWHLHDWVWAKHKSVLKTKLTLRDKDDLVRYLISNCPEFEAIQGIANGSKHFQSQQTEPQSTALNWGSVGTLALWGYTSLSIDFKGKTLNFPDVLHTCVAYWDNFFKQHIP